MKDYQLTSLKKNDYIDKNGNRWADGSFLGVSEPVKIVTPDPDKWIVGEKYYGELLESNTSTGKIYLRFKRHPRPEAPTEGTTSPSTGFRDSDSIKAQFAIKAAVQLLYNPEADVKEDLILHWANIFYDMVDSVKNHKTEPEFPETKPNLYDPIEKNRQALREWDSIGKGKDGEDIPVYEDLPPIEAYGS